jgi:hypothetical protein
MGQGHKADQLLKNRKNVLKWAILRRNKFPSILTKLHFLTVEGVMTSLATHYFPKASTEAITEFEVLFSVASSCLSPTQVSH